ncbi:MAG: hypothetical protein R3D44_06075 [Hyphomicrobiaceae bacterium]
MDIQKPTTVTPDVSTIMPNWLSTTEEKLYNEFLTSARRLGRKGHPGIYQDIADVVESVAEAKAQGRSAIRELAEGLDLVNAALQRHRLALRTYQRQVCRDWECSLVTAVTFGVGAVGAIMFALAVWSPVLYVGAFMAIVSIGSALPVAISLLRRPVL